jgi:hypothetical protein
MADLREKKPRRWIGRSPYRRSLLLLVAFGVLSLLFLIYQRAAGKWAYQAWIREARARGERFNQTEVQELFAISNGLDVLSEASLNALVAPCGNLGRHVAEYDRITNGCFPVVRLDPARTPDSEGAVRWEESLQYCVTNRASIEPLIARLDAGPFVIEPCLDLQGVLNIFDVIQAARHFRLQAVVALQAEDRDAARAWLRRGLRLQRALSYQADLVGQLGHLAVGAIAFPCAWTLIEGAEWTDQELAEMNAAWREAEFVAPLERGLHGERAKFLHFFPGEEQDAHLRASGGRSWTLPSQLEWPSAPFLEDGLGGELVEPVQALVRRAHPTVWRFAWGCRDKLFYVQTLQAHIDSLRTRMRDRGPLTPPPPGFPHSGRPTQWQHLTRLGSILILPKVWQVSRDAAMAETKRELVCAAIALKRYKLRHGTLPNALEELVPELLEELPWDWQAGRPLTYRLREDEGFLLYGWGENEKDDGGAVGADGWLYGPDLVWPTVSRSEFTQ